MMALGLPVCFAQDSEDGEKPLGDVAREMRRDKQEEKKAAEPRVIDNENLDHLMTELQSQRFNRTSLLFSFDSSARDFKVSAPDVTCSLSFNAKATSLISDPFVQREVPSGELAKLDGPAAIHGNKLEISVYNGSEWSIKELTVGLTTLRVPHHNTYGPQFLQPAAETVVESSEKRSDQTVLYHLKGTAAPQSTTVFTADLTEEPSPDQEWHWAIVGAKGVPVPPPAAADPSRPLASVPTAGPVPATSTDNPRQ
jgi:hypothetical protein